MGGAAARVHLDRARRLASHDDALVPVAASARRPRSTGTRPSRRSARRGRTAPARHSSSQTSSSAASAKSARALGQRAQRPEREHDAALHVDACPSRAGARRRARSGRWCACADDGVDVAEQQDPAAAACRGSVASRSGAWSGEEQGGRSTSASAGSSAAQIGRALLGAVHVARRRRDGDERLELAHGAPRDRQRLPLHPRVHGDPGL